MSDIKNERELEEEIRVELDIHSILKNYNKIIDKKTLENEKMVRALKVIVANLRSIRMSPFSLVNDSPDTVKVFLEHGARTFPSDLINAVSIEEIEIIKMLLEKNKALITEEALTLASKNGFVEVVEILLEYGVPVYEQAIEASVKGEYPEITNLLLQVKYNCIKKRKKESV